LAQWVSLVLKKTLKPNNIRKGFEATSIWPLNPNVMQGKHPYENFKNVQEPTYTNSVVVDELQVYEILGTFTTNDAQDTCHYFVDLEGSGANGHSDKGMMNQMVDVVEITTRQKLGQIWGLTDKFNKFTHHRMFSLHLELTFTHKTTTPCHQFPNSLCFLK